MSNELKFTDERLNDIRSRCEAATEGPWKSYIEGRDHVAGDTFILTRIGSSDEGEFYLSGASDADHDFIAKARQDIPALLQEVRRLRSMLK